jgi:Recombination endonuclease VII
MPNEVFKCGHPKEVGNIAHDRGIERCRMCKVSGTALWRRNHREKSRASSRAWSKANPEWHALLVKRSRLRTMLGKDAPEHFEEQARLQSDLCAICKTLMRKACSDHNHETGQCRGVLCDRCNRAIGLLKEQVPILEAAIAYLKKWQ